MDGSVFSDLADTLGRRGPSRIDASGSGSAYKASTTTVPSLASIPFHIDGDMKSMRAMTVLPNGVSFGPEKQVSGYPRDAILPFHRDPPGHGSNQRRVQCNVMLWNQYYSIGNGDLVFSFAPRGCMMEQTKNIRFPIGQLRASLEELDKSMFDQSFLSHERPTPKSDLDAVFAMDSSCVIQTFDDIRKYITFWGVQTEGERNLMSAISSSGRVSASNIWSPFLGHDITSQHVGIVYEYADLNTDNTLPFQNSFMCSNTIENCTTCKGKNVGGLFPMTFEDLLDDDKYEFLRKHVFSVFADMSRLTVRPCSYFEVSSVGHPGSIVMRRFQNSSLYTTYVDSDEQYSPTNLYNRALNTVAAETGIDELKDDQIKDSATYQGLHAHVNMLIIDALQWKEARINERIHVMYQHIGTVCTTGHYVSGYPQIDISLVETSPQVM